MCMRVAWGSYYNAGSGSGGVRWDPHAGVLTCSGWFQHCWSTDHTWSREGWRHPLRSIPKTRGSGILNLEITGSAFPCVSFPPSPCISQSYGLTEPIVPALWGCSLSPNTLPQDLPSHSCQHLQALPSAKHFSSWFWRFSSCLCFASSSPLLNC